MYSGKDDGTSNMNTWMFEQNMNDLTTDPKCIIFKIQHELGQPV